MNFHKSCPIPQTHGRLHEVHRFWHEAAESYQDPVAFNVKLNSTIQAIRNVTFILQSELSKDPDFKDWYESCRKKMSSIEFMVKLRDARNYVVKQGDLEKQSVARVTILTHQDNPIITEEVLPKLTLPELLENYRAKIQNPNPHWDVVLEVNRSWIVSDFPNEEILSVLRNAYYVLHEILKEWHEIQGVDVRICKLADLPCGNDTCSMDASQFITMRASLADGQAITVKNIPLPISDELEQKALKRYGIKKVVKKSREKSLHDRDDAPWSDVDWLFRTAKQILKKDKYHDPIFYLFKDGKLIGLFPVRYKDRASKYLMVRDMADLVKKMGADGIIFITESWRSVITYDDRGNILPPEQVKDRQELLNLFVATSDGRAKVYHTVFVRGYLGGITFGEITSSDIDRDSFLAPFYKIWDQEQ